MTAPTATAPPVTVDAVRGGLRRALERQERRAERGHASSRVRAVALRAAPEWHGPSEITVDHRGRQVRARVAPAPTVLAVLAELSRPSDTDYLVLLTPCGTEDLGASLLGRLVGHEVVAVNSWELLADEFGLRMLDPRLHSRRWAWLAGALYDIGTGAEWRRGTTVLKLDDALHRVAAVRFGHHAGDRLDAAALLDWTRDPARVTRYTSLPAEERDGLRTALEHDVGAVAQVVFRMLDRHQIHDTLPVGLVLRELLDEANADLPGVREARIRAEERFLGAPPLGPDTLRRFADSCEAALLRMMDGAEHDAAVQASGRAEEILAALGADRAAAASRVLAPGLQARLAALGAQISVLVRPGTADIEPQDLAPVEEALTRLWEHRRCSPFSREAAGALNAVRLTRWLASRPADPATVADGVAAHLADTAWVDRAASTLRTAYTESPALGDAYRDLYARVRDRRSAIDEAFARRVAAWTEMSAHTDELLLAENLLDRVARPVAAQHPPLIVVLDGMSAEVAVQLGEQITADGQLTEISRSGRGREGALATLPSVTTCSRASLLCGRLTTGGQSEERAGFPALWRQASWGRRPSTLLYQRDLETGVGDRLPDEVHEALGDPDRVVAVVLNTIDDALGNGREGDTTAWSTSQIGKLPALLDAARRAERPIILTSDHGHVWDRGENHKVGDGEAARYRTGTPGERELLVTGDRVLAGGGRIVVPWDERVRYTSRRAGYHGGISTAEMVIPVLVFVPDTRLAPSGWRPLRPTQHEPAWWTRPLPVPTRHAAPAAPPPTTSRTRAEPVQDTALFGAEEATRSLGQRVVDSPVFAAVREQVPRGPSRDEVAAVIDELAGIAGDRPRLPVERVARAAGKEPFRAARFVKMVAKMLNVETFPVLVLTDAERAVELNIPLLREQFPEGAS
ncbi:BREX-2 system phosphatase PglZ [Thermobifida halotolerans]|uniref:BREX-2 system phosphatase PglZ n=1 Tax=Thermobifida halotolerans TaxID=483545 RepID=A0A399G2H5_9ACTN|nr:BREX-2 system phosphatase PglZ [Thermobifida halotolerans]UOE19789.1 BREX-2 system phosphatase PglZ [Thermobifida halotolerans]